MEIVLLWTTPTRLHFFTFEAFAQDHKEIGDKIPPWELIITIRSIHLSTHL